MKTPSKCLRKGLEALARRESRACPYPWAPRAAIPASSQQGEDILSSPAVEGFAAAKASFSLAYQESIPTRGVWPREITVLISRINCAVLHGLQFLLMSSGQVGIFALNGAASAMKDGLASKSLPSPVYHVYGRSHLRSCCMEKGGCSSHLSCGATGQLHSAPGELVQPEMGLKQSLLQLMKLTSHSE